MRKKDVFFGQRFTERLDHWKKENNSTQEKFVELVGVKSPNSVGDWKKGSVPQPQNLEKICEVFGVDKSYFFPQTKDDLYKYSSEYMSDEIAKFATDYCKTIGLDLDFIRAIRKMFGSDFDNLFPVWGPLASEARLPFLTDENPRYIHDISRLSPSAPMTDHLDEVFQMNIEIERGKTTEHRLVTLGSVDMDFLYYIQEKVRNYVAFLFYEKANQRKQEETEASEKCVVKTEGAGISFIPLTGEQLNAIDRDFRNYTDDKTTEGK